MAGGRGLTAGLAAYLRAEKDLGRVAVYADPDTAATMIVGARHEAVLPHVFRGAVAGRAERVASCHGSSLFRVYAAGSG
jgi:hypothetical protein